MKNTFENKSLEELKEERAKNKKIFGFFCGVMIVATIATIYNAYTDKNWEKLGFLGVLLTGLPLYSGIQALENEIKSREETKE